MRRALIGACLGAIGGVLAIAGFGGWAGFAHVEWIGGANVTPGWSAAMRGAFVYTAYLWWLGVFVGGLIGGVAGLGSWLVRYRDMTSASRS